MHCRDGMTFRGTRTSRGMATEVVWMMEDLIYADRLRGLGLFGLEKREEMQ